MIEIHPGRYAVDIEGNVYSLRNNGGTLRKVPLKMRQRLCKEGYMTVVFWLEGKTHLKLVHRLIAQAFIPNAQNKPEVNHKNGVKTQNCISNLEWVTRSENAIHAFDLGLRSGGTHLLGKINEECSNSKPIRQLSKERCLIREWPSIAEAARNGFSQGNISSVIAGNRKSHKGFLWELV